MDQLLEHDTRFNRDLRLTLNQSWIKRSKLRFLLAWNKRSSGTSGGVARQSARSLRSLSANMLSGNVLHCIKFDIDVPTMDVVFICSTISNSGGTTMVGPMDEHETRRGERIIEIELDESDGVLADFLIIPVLLLVIEEISIFEIMN